MLALSCKNKNNSVCTTYKNFNRLMTTTLHAVLVYIVIPSITRLKTAGRNQYSYVSSLQVPLGQSSLKV